MTYPTQTTAGPGTPVGQPRSKRRVVVLVALVSVLVLVFAVMAAETYVRHRYANCIARGVEQGLHSKVSVHFGPKPLLLTAFDHQVQYVTVNSNDVRFGPAQDMQVRARLNDIGLNTAGATVGSSSATATWSDTGIQKTLGGVVSGVQSNPSDGTLAVKVLGGLADVHLQPHVANNRIEITSTSASLLGLGIPTDLVNGILEQMTKSLQGYPLGLQPTHVDVTATGLNIALAGGPTTLPAANGNQPSC